MVSGDIKVKLYFLSICYAMHSKTSFCFAQDYKTDEHSLDDLVVIADYGSFHKRGVPRMYTVDSAEVKRNKHYNFEGLNGELVGDLNGFYECLEMHEYGQK